MRKNLKDLSPRGRFLFRVATSVQFSLLATALVDLYRRPEDQINGSKRWWTAGVFVNFVGPIAYFAFGCKRKN